MENYSRIVIDLYKKAFFDYKNGKQQDTEILTEAQKTLNFAIDRAKVNNEPTDELEALTSDINYLKYDLI